nr:metallophosphoesterase [Marinicella sp. W31]MDC2879702.1 metallophosphoesterase [Marinicella sp. W31]
MERTGPAGLSTEVRIADEIAPPPVFVSKTTARPGPRAAFLGGLPKPEQAFVAIGDVHGCADSLVRLWDKIDQQAPGMPVVHVGDYIDRGNNRPAFSKCCLNGSATEGTPSV